MLRFVKVFRHKIALRIDTENSLFKVDTDRASSCLTAKEVAKSIGQKRSKLSTEIGIVENSTTLFRPPLYAAYGHVFAALAKNTICRIFSLVDNSPPTLGAARHREQKITFDMPHLDR